MRQDQWSNSVTIDGVDWGVWDTLAGGAVESGETKYRPGGMGGQVSLGGLRTVGNLTLGRLLDKEDWPRMRALMQTGVGKSEVGTARQPLDTDGKPFGKPLLYTGKLLSVTPGDTDSNSTAAQVWQIVVSTEGEVG